ncbi:uncharacterized protein LOC122642380 [Telopea speciosissima]|uniref:uncharacterized protein LOC122642380 n=1 Tax=Telopea speciosissima TaxID=54955 RepID=UPI001CC6F5B8|nr:uncharacterized protein LOC122642380 [Telopea speciosissima]
MANFQRLISATTLTLSLISVLSAINLSLAVPNDVYDLLPQYGLPKGLIPDAVKSFSMSDEGDFEVELERTCYVQFDELVYYDKKITGKLSYGAVSDVSGIQAKKLFVWVPVTGIKAVPNSDLIEFYVGFLSEQFPAKQFETIPACKSRAYENQRGTELESFVSEV